eukprot:4650866-Pleurochrysis_carterae.AAC.2
MTTTSSSSDEQVVGEDVVTLESSGWMKNEHHTDEQELHDVYLRLCSSNESKSKLLVGQEQWPRQEHFEPAAEALYDKLSGKTPHLYFILGVLTSLTSVLGIALAVATLSIVVAVVCSLFFAASAVAGTWMIAALKQSAETCSRKHFSIALQVRHGIHP